MFPAEHVRLDADDEKSRGSKVRVLPGVPISSMSGPIEFDPSQFDFVCDIKNYSHGLSREINFKASRSLQISCHELEKNCRFLIEKMSETVYPEPR